MGGKEIEKIVEMLRDSIEEKIGPYSDCYNGGYIDGLLLAHHLSLKNKSITKKIEEEIKRFLVFVENDKLKEYVDYYFEGLK